MLAREQAIINARLNAEKEVRNAINGPTPEESLKKLAETGGYYVQYYLVMLCYDEEFLETLYYQNDNCPQVRRLIVTNKNMSQSLMMKVCDDESEDVILALLQRPDLTLEMVNVISKRNFTSKRFIRAVERAILEKTN